MSNKISIKSLIPGICEYLVEERNLSCHNETDRLIIHLVCFLTIGKLFRDREIYEYDIIVTAEMQGPFIDSVDEWFRRYHPRMDEWIEKYSLLIG